MRIASACVLAGGLMVAFAAAAAGPAAAAKAPRGERYYVNVTRVNPGKGVPPEIAGRAKELLLKIIASRREFVPTLAGAPDPKNAVAFRKYLRAKRLRAFNVEVKLDGWERVLQPNTQVGKSGQVLKVHAELSIIGTAIPDDVMALSGEGSATVAAEVGKVVSAKDDEYAATAALEQALGHALDEAVRRLRGK